MKLVTLLAGLQTSGEPFEHALELVCASKELSNTIAAAPSTTKQVLLRLAASPYHEVMRKVLWHPRSDEEVMEVVALQPPSGISAHDAALKTALTSRRLALALLSGRSPAAVLEEGGSDDEILFALGIVVGGKEATSSCLPPTAWTDSYGKTYASTTLGWADTYLNDEETPWPATILSYLDAPALARNLVPVASRSASLAITSILADSLLEDHILPASDLAHAVAACAGDLANSGEMPALLALLARQIAAACRWQAELGSFYELSTRLTVLGSDSVARKALAAIASLSVPLPTDADDLLAAASPATPPTRLAELAAGYQNDQYNSNANWDYSAAAILAYSNPAIPPSGIAAARPNFLNRLPAAAEWAANMRDKEVLAALDSGRSDYEYELAVETANKIAGLGDLSDPSNMQDFLAIFDPSEVKNFTTVQWREALQAVEGNWDNFLSAVRTTTSLRASAMFSSAAWMGSSLPDSSLEDLAASLTFVRHSTQAQYADILAIVPTALVANTACMILIGIEPYITRGRFIPPQAARNFHAAAEFFASNIETVRELELLDWLLETNSASIADAAVLVKEVKLRVAPKKHDQPATVITATSAFGV